jgi:hypothetical protein
MDIWRENEALRQTRSSPIDPWKSSDNFRINHVQSRDLKLNHGEETVDCKVEYLSENKFNITIGDQTINNVEFFSNPEKAS